MICHQKPKEKRWKKNANNSPIEASFEEYYAHHFSAVNEENPQWDENRVYEFLKKQWDMHEKSKERRKSNMESSPRPKKHGTLTMKHFFKSLHENEKGSKRGRKPSAKLLQLITSDPESLPYMEIAESEKADIKIHEQVPEMSKTPVKDIKPSKKRESPEQLLDIPNTLDQEIEQPKEREISESFSETQKAPVQGTGQPKKRATSVPETPKPFVQTIEVVKKRGRKKKSTSTIVSPVFQESKSKSEIDTSKPLTFEASTPKLVSAISTSKPDSTNLTPKLSASGESASKKSGTIISTKITAPASSLSISDSKMKEPVSTASKNGQPILASKTKSPSKLVLPTEPSQSSMSKPKQTNSSVSKPELASVSKPKLSSSAALKPKMLTCSALSPKLSATAVSTPKLPASAVSVRKSSQDSDSSTEIKGKGLRENEQYELEIFKLYSSSTVHKVNVCAVCEKTGDSLVECSGSCNLHFHPKCLGIEEPKNGFKCSECISGNHSCFKCNKKDGETKKCSVALCGKYYHENCVKQLRLTRMDSKGFVCPMHTCATCAVDNIKNPKALKGRLFRCVRCPTAYHVGDLCIAAGSEILGGMNIICSNHFQPQKALSMHSRVNITWCFTCSKGGNLLCCESCPASFHADCVKVDKTPDEAWYCMDCEAGSRLLYGSIVWIKVGNYRWWPGEVCHPRNVPDNIRNRKHQVGEFPCRFFGSHDYYWLHQGRVFLFQEGDKASKESAASKGLFKVYSKGVAEATEAFKLWTAAQVKKEEQEQERSEKKPAHYKAIKVNFPIGNVQIYKAELSDIPRCECKPNIEDPCASDCLNRMMFYECHPSVCNAGDRCCNQRFQKRQYPDCAPFKCEGRGWGLRCNEDIKKGQFVAEYIGDLIDEEECKRRIEQAHEDNISNFYMLTMDKNRIIDAGPKGNFSRFMNHSCCPNLETQKWMVNGDIRVGLFTLRDCIKGEELTFNYNLECIGNEKKACCCGADNCSGFLGVRPKTAAAAAQEKRAREANSKEAKKKKKKKVRKEHEDDCFRCGWGGELVMCDKGNCPKVYHLQCLKLTKPPMGKWLCPWHHCDDCGKIATSKCSECPNSYCAVHAPGNVFVIQGLLICSDHSDLLEESAMSLKTPSIENGVLADTATGSESDSSSNIAVSNSSTSSCSVKRSENKVEKTNGQVIQTTITDMMKKQQKIGKGVKKVKKEINMEENISDLVIDI